MIIESEKKPIGYNQAFEETVWNARIVVDRETVYMVGLHGWFKVGRTDCGKVTIAQNDLVKRYRKNLEDKAKEAGYELMAPFVDADWEYVYGKRR